MARRVRRHSDEVPMNMTPMIDVVFQLMIFFLVTFKVDKEQINEEIKLAWSPNGPPVPDYKDPRQVIIEVDRNGHIMMARNRLSPKLLETLMRNHFNRFGATAPIVVRADAKAKHEDVRKVFDVCSNVGYWRIKIVAIKEAAGQAPRVRP